MVVFNTLEKEYTLRITTKSCVSMEKKLGKNPINVFMEATEDNVPKISDLMIILHGCLEPLNHGITLEKVCDLYDKYCENGGDLLSLINLLIDVFKEGGFIPNDDEEKN